MSEVRLDIRAYENVEETFERLKAKAREYGIQINEELKGNDNLTKTEKRVAVEQDVQAVYSEIKNKIKSDYDEIRRSNWREFKDVQDAYKRGDISEKSWRHKKEIFEGEQQLLDKQEIEELKEIEKEKKDYIKEIWKEISNKDKIESEKAQRDKTEFGELGRLKKENYNYRRQQEKTDDKDEIERLQKKIDENNEKIKNLKGKESDSSGGGGGGQHYLMAASAAGRGDVFGTVASGMKGVAGTIGKGAVAAGVTAAFIYGIKEFLGTGDKLRESLELAGATRGGFSSAYDANYYYQTKIAGDSRVADLGMLGEQMGAQVNAKILASKISRDAVERTLQDVAFKKGFGADVSVFSKFERFEIHQEKSVEIGLDLLNVLTKIKESNLKKNDLASLGEKIAAQQSIMEIQRQRRDLVDSDKALRILSAFESLGLSSKGEYAGSFLQSTLQSLGDVGSDNERLLKFEALRRAFPELANNPAALRRQLKFHSDDPKYLRTAFQFLGQISGGSEMAMDDLIFTMFNPKSEKDYEMIKKAISGNKQFANLLQGVGVDKTRDESLNVKQMFEDAKASVGNITDFVNSFRNFMQKISVGTNGAMNVNVVQDKTKGANTNKVRQGE